MPANQAQLPYPFQGTTGIGEIRGFDQLDEGLNDPAAPPTQRRRGNDYQPTQAEFELPRMNPDMDEDYSMDLNDPDSALQAVLDYLNEDGNADGGNDGAR